MPSPPLSLARKTRAAARFSRASVDAGVARLRSWVRRSIFGKLWRGARGEAAQPKATAPEFIEEQTLEPVDRDLWRSLVLLRRVLGRHPKARKVFPHLAMLERKLRKGEAEVRRLPVQLVDQACQQLVSVSTEDETEVLAELLERMGHGIAAMTLRAQDLPQDFSLSRFAPEVLECDEAEVQPWAETTLGKAQQRG